MSVYSVINSEAFLKKRPHGMLLVLWRRALFLVGCGFSHESPTSPHWLVARRFDGGLSDGVECFSLQ